MSSSRRIRLGSALLAPLLVSAAALAQLRNGGDFLVNVTTTGNQSRARVAHQPDGFVIVWEKTVSDGAFARRFARSGAPQSGEIVLSATGAFSDVAVDAQGRFVVVWAEAQTATARLFDSVGGPIAPAFRVSSGTTGSQTAPRVVREPTGAFAVAWGGNGTGDATGIFARRFDSAGNALTSDFRVNEYVTGSQTRPSLARRGDGSGELVVVWDGAGTGDLAGIFGRRFDSAGAPLTGTFLVNTTTGDNQTYPAVAGNPGDGSFVVVWVGFGAALDIFGQRFGTNGAPLGGEFRVNTYTTSNQVAPSVSVEPGGGFVVVWRGIEGSDGSLTNVTGQRYAPDGSPAGGPFFLSTYTANDQGGPHVAARGPNDFVAVFHNDQNRDGNGTGVYAQRYGPRGDVDGDGVVTIADVFYLISNLFAAGPAPTGPADANADLAVTVADVFALINALFAGGTLPA